MMFKPCLLLGLACGLSAWAQAAEPAQPQAAPEIQWLRSLRPALERSPGAAPAPEPAGAGPAASAAARPDTAVTPTATVAAPTAAAPTATSSASPIAPIATAPIATAPGAKANADTAATATVPTALTAAAAAPKVDTTAPAQPATVKAAPAELPQAQEWAILLSDKTLYRTMRRWAQQANLQLLWQVDRDYPIEAEVVFNSSLHQAVGQVMAGVALTDYPLQAVFNSSARVLRVVRHMDDQRR